MGDELTSADFRVHCATCGGAITPTFVSVHRDGSRGWVHIFVSDWQDNVHEAIPAIESVKL